MSQATPPLPGFDCAHVIRTPKRLRRDCGPAAGGGPAVGYAAQLWGAHGYWALGTFGSITEARAAARTFAAADPDEPGREEWRRDPAATGALLFLLGCEYQSELLAVWWLCSDWWAARWVCRRRPPDDPDESPRWVRRVKGGAYQSRYWLEVVGGSLNLGLFTLAEHDNDWELARWAAARTAKAFRWLWVGSRTVAEAVQVLQKKRPPPADWPPKWKLRTPWVPEHVTVPAKWAHLTLPTETGPVGYAHERRAKAAAEREQARYAGGTLLPLFLEFDALAA